MTQSTPTPEQKQVVGALFDVAPHTLEGRTYVQKVAFLIQREAEVQAFVFEPHDYGPFSRDLYHVLEHLVEYDYVTERREQRDDGSIWYCYEAGEQVDELFESDAVDADLREAARTVFEEFPTDDLPDLVRRVYSECPRMAQNSIY